MGCGDRFRPGLMLPGPIVPTGRAIGFGESEVSFSTDRPRGGQEPDPLKVAGMRIRSKMARERGCLPPSVETAHRKVFARGPDQVKEGRTCPSRHVAGDRRG